MQTARTRLGGRYRLGEVVGRGGMSTVYRATDAVLGRTVAVKVLSPALADEDPVWGARFEREARAAASLTHSGVATVYDTGVEDGTRFIVMEFVPGRSLATIVTEEAPFEPARAVEIGAQVADVLSAAHAAGIVHRDIKPGNVIVGPDGRVKVLDFGIARAGDGTALTQTVAVLGTAAYMAPEQASGQRADARSDIYSLGCVLYAMLAGSPPFAGELAAAVLHQHVTAAPRPLRELAREVPPPLAALVEKMLAKSPDARPQSAGEVRDRLRSALDPTAPTVIAAADEAPVATARTERSPDARRAGAGRGLAVAAVALLALVIVAAAIASLGSKSTGHKSAGTKPRGTATPGTTRAASTPSATTTKTAPAGGAAGQTSTPPAKGSPPAKGPPAKGSPPGKESPPAKAKAPKGTAKPHGPGGVPPGQAKKHGPAHGGGDGGDGGDTGGG